MSKAISQEFKTELKLVTPAYAQELLAKNINNRHLSKGQLERMVYAMKNDQWKANGETIKISRGGRLLDGQHRLTAIVEANVSCLLLICEGVEDEAVDTIDIGKRRTFSDWLDINGEDAPRDLAAVLTKLAIYRNYYSKNFYVAGKTGLSKHNSYQDLEKLLKDNAGVRTSVSQVNRSDARRLFEKSTLMTMHYLLNSANPEKCMEFFNSLGSGANLAEDSPVLLLRQTAIKWKSANYKPDLYEVMTFIIRTWNAYVNGRALQFLRFNPDESFPEIAGLPKEKEHKAEKPQPKKIGRK